MGDIYKEDIPTDNILPFPTTSNLCLYHHACWTALLQSYRDDNGAHMMSVVGWQQGTHTWEGHKKEAAEKRKSPLPCYSLLQQKQTLPFLPLCEGSNLAGLIFKSGEKKHWLLLTFFHPYFYILCLLLKKIHCAA